MMKKLEFKLGLLRNNSINKISFTFIFNKKGDVFITPNFKEKLYRSTKISLHPHKKDSQKNYQSYSFQRGSNSNRHIQQTLGDFDIGKDLHIRHSLLIHSSLLDKNGMFEVGNTDCDIKFDDQDDIIDITTLSSPNRFTGTPGKKDGYKNILDVQVKDSLQFSLVFKGRKILNNEVDELRKIAKVKDIDKYPGTISILGNTKEGFPVTSYVNLDYVLSL